MTSTDPTPPTVRRAPTPRERRDDLILAAVILVGAIISAFLSATSGVYAEEQNSMQSALIYAVVLAVPLAVRRRWPATVAVIVSTAYFVAVTIRIPEIYVGNIAMFIALYTVGAWAVDRRRAAIVRVAIIVGMLAWLLIVMFRDVMSEADDADVVAGAFSPYVAALLLSVLVNLLYFGGAYYFGERAWASAVQRAALAQRTLELEQERQVTADQAVTLDRVRIARELHDVVAHHVSLMGVQAAAARAVFDRDPDAAKQSLGAIEVSAREAIDELHRLLDTLRTPGSAAPGTDTAPSIIDLEALPALSASSEAAGVPTTFTVVGDPVAVPSFVQVNVYRIAQEALTNARRHGGIDVTADVRLRYVGAEAIELEVVNTGRLISSLQPGLGLRGMRERAAVSGGELEYGPRPRGGFRVRLRIPLTGAAVAPSTPEDHAGLIEAGR